MFPRLHLGTLMTVNDIHVAEKTRKRKQAVLEARVSRSMEGFFIYQTYLKRLRRMHRAYVAKYKQQQTQTMGSSQISNFHATSLANQNEPLTNHRLSLAGAFVSNKEVNDQASPEVTCNSSHNLQKHHEGRSLEYGNTNCNLNRPLVSQPRAIRIPCGRESSFEITQNPSNDSFSRENKFNQRSHGNTYLPFRLWKQNGVKSLYSQPSNSNMRKLTSTPVQSQKSAQLPKFVPKLIPRHAPRSRIKP